MSTTWRGNYEGLYSHDFDDFFIKKKKKNFQKNKNKKTNKKNKTNTVCSRFRQHRSW